MSYDPFNLGKMFAQHLVERAKQPTKFKPSGDPTTRNASRASGDEYVASLNPKGHSAVRQRLEAFHKPTVESQRGQLLTSNSGNSVSSIHSDQFVQQLRGGLVKAVNPDSRIIG